MKCDCWMSPNNPTLRAPHTCQLPFISSTCAHMPPSHTAFVRDAWNRMIPSYTLATFDMHIIMQPNVCIFLSPTITQHHLNKYMRVFKPEKLVSV